MQAPMSPTSNIEQDSLEYW